MIATQQALPLAPVLSEQLGTALGCASSPGSPTHKHITRPSPPRILQPSSQADRNSRKGPNPHSTTKSPSPDKSTLAEPIIHCHVRQDALAKQPHLASDIQLLNMPFNIDFGSLDPNVLEQMLDYLRANPDPQPDDVSFQALVDDAIAARDWMLDDEPEMNGVPEGQSR
jgi:hypothetical protein